MQEVWPRRPTGSMKKLNGPVGLERQGTGRFREAGDRWVEKANGPVGWEVRWTGRLGSRMDR